jgi:hypothetical protein
MLVSLGVIRTDEILPVIFEAMEGEFPGSCGGPGTKFCHFPD